MRLRPHLFAYTQHGGTEDTEGTEKSIVSEK